MKQRSSATPLAWAMAALVLYASLYPFTGWRWPAGGGASDLLVLPWPRWQLWGDEAFNFAGYVPLGLLLMIAAVRSGVQPWVAGVGGLVLAALLSYSCEVLQHLLPERHPSLKDWVFNVAGAAVGAACGLLLQRSGALDRWQRLRQRWFVRHSAGALALLALWPAALLFPTPVPWGLGQIGEPLREALQSLFAGVPWAEGWLPGALPPAAGAAAALRPLSPWAERVCALLGLVAPVLLAYAISRSGWHRVWLALGAIAAGLLAMTVSTTLNFGPQHALAWLTPAALAGAGGALFVALLLVPVAPRAVLGVALIVLAAGVALVSQAPTDPYFAQTLQAWEQGRFVRFHGLAQWLGWLWPYATMLWLLMRLSQKDTQA